MNTGTSWAILSRERGWERWSPLWRPFEAWLSAGAQRQAITILGNLYGFLVDQNYLMGNPWSSVMVPRGPVRVSAGRSFTAGQWAFIEAEILALSNTSANQLSRRRLRRVVTRSRRAVEDLQWLGYPSVAQDDEPLSGFILRVIGKDQKEREVPVPDAVVAEINAYLQSRGLTQAHTLGDGRACLAKPAMRHCERRAWRV